MILGIKGLNSVLELELLEKKGWCNSLVVRIRNFDPSSIYYWFSPCSKNLSPVSPVIFHNQTQTPLISEFNLLLVLSLLQESFSSLSGYSPQSNTNSSNFRVQFIIGSLLAPRIFLQFIRLFSTIKHKLF